VLNAFPHFIINKEIVDSFWDSEILPWNIIMVKLFEKNYPNPTFNFFPHKTWPSVMSLFMYKNLWISLLFMFKVQCYGISKLLNYTLQLFTIRLISSEKTCGPGWAWSRYEYLLYIFHLKYRYVGKNSISRKSIKGTLAEKRVSSKHLRGWSADLLKNFTIVPL
jgi:hypothetical protein